VLFFGDEAEKRYALRFASDDGLLCLPLSGQPAPPERRLRRYRAAGYEELEQYFVTRYFQYRLIRDRQLRLGTSLDCDGLLQVGPDSPGLEELFALNAEICEELRGGLSFQPLPAPDLPPQSSLHVYCAIDGWVKPLVRSLTASGSGTMHYLLCPECLGNIAFQAEE